MLPGLVAVETRNLISALHPLGVRLAGPAVLFVLLIVVFGDALLASPMPVISEEGRDGHRYFSVSRAFGFGEISDGNLPLWNPHVFAGVPYLSGIQSALLYPVNLIYMLLPLSLAMNVDILFHIWLFGFGIFLWVRDHDVGRAPAVFAGAISMFAAPHFLHVWSGHFTLIAAFAWAPFLFRALDKILDRPSLRETALGIVPITMMILAGFPQAAYCCALIGMVYLVLRVQTFAKQPSAKLIALLALAVVPAILAAAQLGPTAEFARESVRADGVDHADSFAYSIAPHHFIRAFAPGFFGGTTSTQYWGGGYPLESGVFLGRTGIIMMLIALFSIRRQGGVAAAIIVLICGTVALGYSTPLAPLLHACVPGFDSFRAPGRYWIFAAMFGALLAARGLQRLSEDGWDQRWLRYSSIGIAFAAWIGFAFTWLSVRYAKPESAWTGFVDAARMFGEEVTISKKEALEFASQTAPISVLVTAIFLSVFAGLCWAPLNARWRVLAIVGLGCMEMTMFARSHRQTFDAALLDPPNHEAYDISQSEGSRVISLAANNEAMRSGAYDISGYEPGLLYRFNRFLSHPGPGLYTRRPDDTLKGNGVASLLRCLNVIDKDDQILPTQSVPLPRFSVISDFEIIPNEVELLDRLYARTYRARVSVFLGTDPGITPNSDVKPSRNNVRVLDASTDHVNLEVDAPEGGLLLCTDSYSTGWRVTALPDSAQWQYEIIPANYAMRAVPLQPGKHRLRFYYEPRTFRPGLWLSIFASLVLNVVLVRLLYLRLRRSASDLVT
jgi:hypothetical protein